jgi:protein-S-isoprenylcysteine O-methyltransferase Ste14
MVRAFCFIVCLQMDAGAKFVLLAPILPIVAIMAFYWHGPWTLMRISGVLIAIASFAMLTWARVNLGNSFSIAPEAKQLVTHGVYSKVRHPVYTFGILLFIGLAMYVARPWFLIGMLVLVPIQIARARVEEKVLTKKFGAEYLAYRKTTWL